MKVLELFAGTRSIGRAFERRGHEVFSVDWDEKFDDIDWCGDVELLTAEMILDMFGRPDVWWQSPDCTTYSVAAISTHRRREPDGNLRAITPYAEKCDRINWHLRHMIEEVQPRYWFIENPRGGMRKMDFMRGLPRYTVTYCLAGETKVITPYGEKEIGVLSGTTQTLLTINGTWVDAPIREYGTQPLMKVCLSRRSVKKTIYATRDHKWLVDGREVPTYKLRGYQGLDYAEPPRTGHQVRRWKVVSVEETDRVEPVYCAEVPETHCFAIEGDILTHNCQYTQDLPLEQRRMKPTDIWTNHPDPKFKPPCKNGDPCHVRAPRGAQTGTQGLKLVDRSRIPDELCDHIAEISEEVYPYEYKPTLF